MILDETRVVRETSPLAKVAKAGGIAAIIAALADHRDHAQMQYWGQIVLAHLCSLEFGLKRPLSL